MNRNLRTILLLLGFALPFVLIYKAFFLPGSLAWGDAPFFSAENLKVLFNPPLLWNFKDNNFGAPQYYILWLYLPTFLYGLLNHFLGLGNDLLVRLVFYLPATVLGILGTWWFIGRFTQNIGGKFLGSFLYGFNTYILMLIDGGQVGVALAYGLFPLTVISILSYLSNLSIKNYLLALLTLFALISADIRIALMLLLFVGLCWGIDGGRKTETKRRLLIGTVLLGLSVLGLIAYWVIPTLGSLASLGKLGEMGSGTNFVTLLNSLFVFQPHFPLNQFGKTFPTPFYFIPILIITFGSLLFLTRIGDKSEKKRIMFFSLFFLLLAFLAKGGSDPLGQGYSWLINNLPLGVAFRDSSKLYIPLILIGSLLLSFTVSVLQRVLNRTPLFLGAILVIYSYLLILVHPAILGNLSGTLGVKENSDYQKIHKNFKNDVGFARSLWFEERPSQGYFSWENPALAANTLYQERPFASMITGKYDLYNFLHSPQFCQWLDLLGVKYLFFPPNERKKIIELEEKEYWQKTLSVVASSSCLFPINLNTSFPTFTNNQSKPQIFAQKKAILVVGGEGIYDQLIKLQDFSLANQGFIFAEDERVDLSQLDQVGSQNLEIIFFNKDIQDLKMSYLRNWMISPGKAYEYQWKVWDSGDYLGWKYEFLKNEINTREFDFGKGVALSTVAGEKMKFSLKVPDLNLNDYYLAVRFTNAPDSSIKIGIEGDEVEYSNNNPEQFKWEIIGPFKSKVNVDVEITNNGKFSALNTLALIPASEFQRADNLARNLNSRYETFIIKEDQDWDLVIKILQNNISPLPYRQINPTQYQIDNLPNFPLWLVFTDHYHPGWTLQQGTGDIHVPFYAMANGFYVTNPVSNTLIFSPQIEVRKGIILSVLSLAITMGTIVIISLRKKLLKK